MHRHGASCFKSIPWRLSYVQLIPYTRGLHQKERQKWKSNLWAPGVRIKLLSIVTKSDNTNSERTWKALSSWNLPLQLTSRSLSNTSFDVNQDGLILYQVWTVKSWSVKWFLSCVELKISKFVMPVASNRRQNNNNKKI